MLNRHVGQIPQKDLRELVDTTHVGLEYLRVSLAFPFPVLLDFSRARMGEETQLQADRLGGLDSSHMNFISWQIPMWSRHFSAIETCTVLGSRIFLFWRQVSTVTRWSEGIWNLSVV